MANPLIVFTTEWRLVPTTCEPCAVCEDIIYGNQYQLFIHPGGATSTILCEPCKREQENMPDQTFDINIS